MMKKIVIIENNVISTNTMRKKFTTSLIEEGYSVTILTTGTKEDLLTATNNGLSVIDVKSSGLNPLHVLQYNFKLFQILSKIKPDVCLTFTVRPAIWGNLITRLLRIHTITNITGIGPLFSSKNIAYKIARTLYKFVLKHTHTIFFQNTDDKDLFIKNNFVHHQNIGLIPGSGIDHHYYTPIEVKKENDTLKFLFIGRLLKDKGIIEFIEAAKILKQEKINAKYLVVGTLWNQNLKHNTITQKDLDQWIDDGIIDYLGPTTDVRPIIASVDCVVLPSYREGTSNVLLEASSMEKPCITCDTTGCREIVEDQHTGLLCKVADSKDLAEKMKQMFSFSDEKRIEMGKNARKKVVKEFDKQIVLDAYKKAINDCLKNK
jgi:glycosyltransferase involved in cell wall biosynthesis